MKPIQVARLMGTPGGGQTIAESIPGLNVFIPSDWTGAPGLAYLLSLADDGTGSTDTGPSTSPGSFDWTSDGAPPAINYEVRLSGVSFTITNALWVFTNLASSWSPLNSSTGAGICQLVFDGDNGGLSAAASGSGLLEIRRDDTDEVVFSETITIEGSVGGI